MSETRALYYCEDCGNVLAMTEKQAEKYACNAVSYSSHGVAYCCGHMEMFAHFVEQDSAPTPTDPTP